MGSVELKHYNMIAIGIGNWNYISYYKKRNVWGSVKTLSYAIPVTGTTSVTTKKEGLRKCKIRTLSF